jgi:glutamyl/glutaminyl-tRNA synthetase
MPIASGSVDRLDQVPARLSFLFDYSPEATLADEALRAEMNGDASRTIAVALARALAAAPRLDRDRFRAIANQVKAETGQKARALFHPIRIVITGRAAGPELDLAVPAIDAGAELPSTAGLPPIAGCRERAQAFADALQLVNR